MESDIKQQHSFALDHCLTPQIYKFAFINPFITEQKSLDHLD